MPSDERDRHRQKRRPPTEQVTRSDSSHLCARSGESPQSTPGILHSFGHVGKTLPQKSPAETLAGNTPGSHRLSEAGHWARHNLRSWASTITLARGFPLASPNVASQCGIGPGTPSLDRARSASLTARVVFSAPSSRMPEPQQPKSPSKVRSAEHKTIRSTGTPVDRLTSRPGNRSPWRNVNASPTRQTGTTQRHPKGTK